MKVLSFVRYSAESIRRNRRRAVYAVIGIVLAVSLIAGSFIAADSSGMGLLRATIQQVPVDFVAADASSVSGFNDSWFGPRISAIKSVENVEDVAPIGKFPNWWFLNDSGVRFPSSSGSRYMPSGSILFLNQDGKKILDAFKINGSMPDPGTIAIPKDMADDLKLNVGSNITLSYGGNYTWFDAASDAYVSASVYHNVTLRVSRVFTQEGFRDGYYFMDAGTGIEVDRLDGNVVFIGLGSNPVIMNTADYDLIRLPAIAPFTLPGYSPYVDYYIWINRDKVINLADVTESFHRLDFMDHRLTVACEGLDVIVAGQSALTYPLKKVTPRLDTMKTMFVELSLPVVGLGTYLSIVGVDMGANARRREVGMLKSRGASNGQVFGTLMMESLFLGALAGIIGLALGVLVSRFLLTMTGSLRSGMPGLSSSMDLKVGLDSVVLAMVFGVLLMVISSYRPFMKASKTEIAEALHHYSPRTARLEYRPRNDLIMLGLSGWSVISVFLGFSWASGRGYSWIMETVISVLLMAGIAMFPLMPFLLSLSVVRLITLGQRRLYSKLTLLVKPWTKELHYLVDRNIVRNPRRASNLCVIISLALAFGLFISVTTESSIKYERESIGFTVGSDIKIEGGYSGYWDANGSHPELNVGMLQSIGSVPGVERFCTYEIVNLKPQTFMEPWMFARTVVVNASSYIRTVDPSDFYFVDSGKEIMNELKTNGTALLSSDVAKSNGILAGDDLGFSYESSHMLNGSMVMGVWQFNFHVVGFFKGLPGLGNPTAMVDSSSMSFIPEEAQVSGFTEQGAIIKVNPGADPHAVSVDAVDVFSRAGLQANAFVLQDKLEQLKKDPGFVSLSDFLYMEYALSIVIMSVGVGLVVFVAVTDREQELACIMARGSSGAQMRRILMGESLSLMALGLIIGASVGLLVAYLFNVLSGEGLNDAVERKMVFSNVIWLVMAVSVLSLVTASLLATARAGRIKLAEVLRVRSG